MKRKSNINQRDGNLDRSSQQTPLITCWSDIHPRTSTPHPPLLLQHTNDRQNDLQIRFSDEPSAMSTIDAQNNDLRCHRMPLDHLYNVQHNNKVDHIHQRTVTALQTSHSIKHTSLHHVDHSSVNIPWYLYKLDVRVLCRWTSSRNRITTWPTLHEPKRVDERLTILASTSKTPSSMSSAAEDRSQLN